MGTSHWSYSLPLLPPPRCLPPHNRPRPSRHPAPSHALRSRAAAPPLHSPSSCGGKGGRRGGVEAWAEAWVDGGDTYIMYVYDRRQPSGAPALLEATGLSTHTPAGRASGGKAGNEKSPRAACGRGLPPTTTSVASEDGGVWGGAGWTQQRGSASRRRVCAGGGRGDWVCGRAASSCGGRGGRAESVNGRGHRQQRRGGSSQRRMRRRRQPPPSSPPATRGPRALQAAGSQRARQSRGRTNRRGVKGGS